MFAVNWCLEIYCFRLMAWNLLLEIDFCKLIAFNLLLKVHCWKLIGANFWLEINFRKLIAWNWLPKIICWKFIGGLPLRSGTTRSPWSSFYLHTLISNIQIFKYSQYHVLSDNGAPTLSNRLHLEVRVWVCEFTEVSYFPTGPFYSDSLWVPACGVTIWVTLWILGKNFFFLGP